MVYIAQAIKIIHDVEFRGGVAAAGENESGASVKDVGGVGFGRKFDEFDIIPVMVQPIADRAVRAVVPG
jgi:hypothetical protein